MKIYDIGTIGGYMNDSFAMCDYTLYEISHQMNTYSWWKWGSCCPNCDSVVDVEVVPLQLTWYEGSDLIGDFAGAGKDCTLNLLVQSKVIDFFERNNYFACYQDVFFHPYPFRKKRSKYPIVSWPYSGPDFKVVYPKFGVNMNLEKSGIKYEFYCSVCGQKTYDENYKLDFRKKMIVVDEEDWNGLKMFTIFDIGSPINPANGIFLSEEGYDLLKKQGFTNWHCSEVGRIEKAGHGKMLPYREKASYEFWKPEEYVEPLKIETPKKKKKKK
ncbi:MAG: hypothetical protein LBE18_02070 [Planctomycetaceae bacterium]|jgi:hypothetical protein|nr:hypothetical protein [Planctomycetaceae bacterium]